MVGLPKSDSWSPKINDNRNSPRLARLLMRQAPALGRGKRDHFWHEVVDSAQADYARPPVSVPYLCTPSHIRIGRDPDESAGAGVRAMTASALHLVRLAISYQVSNATPATTAENSTIEPTDSKGIF